MPDLWRISNHRNLTGEGGLRYPARWHSAGRRIVYLAESPAGALLEVIVHLELNAIDLPPTYTMLRVEVAPEVLIDNLIIPAEEVWKNNLPTSRRLGDQWLEGGRSALAKVPSVILPQTFNLLLNPLHPQAALVSIAEVIPAQLDRRLLRQSRDR